MLGPVFGARLSRPWPGAAARARAICLGSAAVAALVLLASSTALATGSAAAENSDAVVAIDGPSARGAAARDPTWRALLHQARRRLGRLERRGYHRAGFFLHPQGGQRPDLELDATLAAFTRADPRAAAAARCRYPARFAFLHARGLVRDDPPERGSSADAGPGATAATARCPALEAWRRTLGDVEITLIFPESFLGNPASMFGHTLLRFDRAGARAAGQLDPLLGWALDYTGDSEGGTGPIYLIRGVFGGYDGRFSLAPYFEKIKFYGDWQDRDIWEYPLRMSTEARERLILHLWELRDVALPYFFFTQNCSEKLLQVLAVAWPEIERGGGFPPAVTPIDTVRAIAAVGDTLGEAELRPSPASRLQSAMAEISRDAADRVERLARGELAPEAPALAALAPKARARALELAYDLLRHRYLAGEITQDASRARSLALLRARSRIRIETDASDPAPVGPASATRVADHANRPPTEGHGTARIELASGLHDREAFLELRLQPAYHAAIDAKGGFAEGGEIRVLDTRVRYYPELDRVRLHELVLVDVATASPWRRPFRPLAWHLEAGLRTRMLSSRRDRGLDTEGVFRLQLGAGAANAPLRGLELYGFGEFALEAAPGLQGDVALGPLLRAGLVYSTPRDRYTARAEVLSGLLTGPRSAPWLRGRFEQRLTLSRSWSLVSELRYEHAYDVGHFEGRLGLTRYF